MVSVTQVHPQALNTHNGGARAKPAHRQSSLDAAASRPARSDPVVVALENTGAETGVAEAAIGKAARAVNKDLVEEGDLVEGHAGTAPNRPKPIDVALADDRNEAGNKGRDNRDGTTAEVGRLQVGFHAEHERPQLNVVADLTPTHEAAVPIPVSHQGVLRRPRVRRRRGGGGGGWRGKGGGGRGGGGPP